VIGIIESPVRVRTLAQLGHAYGPDRDKRLILTMHPGDLIGLRPERTAREVFIKAFDVYAYCVRCQATLATLARARERKAAKAQRLANDRQRRAEKRLTRPIA
jgi:hypothetical protein